MEKQSLDKGASLRRVLLLCKAVLLLAAAGAQADEVYRCPDGKGGVLYTQKPCAGGARLQQDRGTLSVVPAPKLPPPTPKAETPPPALPPAPKPDRTSRRADPDAAMTDNCNVDNPDYDPYFCTPGNLWGVYGQSYGPPYYPRPRPPHPRPPRPPHPPHKPEPPKPSASPYLNPPPRPFTPPNR
ncbi:hypothetical protein BJP62_04090 [Jeongeupia sp. USM3]|nr:hypothetical protein BJP62_04090 [Jeongeupia sp. USM3]